MNKGHKKVVPNVPVLEFGSGKSVQDYLVGAIIRKLNKKNVSQQLFYFHYCPDGHSHMEHIDL